MKNKTQKIRLLSVLLTLCLVLSSASILAFAESGAYAVKFYPGDYGTMRKNDQIPFVYYGIDDDANKPYYYKLQVSETDTFGFVGSIMDTLLPNLGYEFAYWTADAAVYQAGSGTAIPAGTALSSDQIQNSVNVRSDNVTFTAHFMQISEHPEDSVIRTAEIVGATLSYKPGETPRATAGVAAADQGKYRIANEYWQELDENDVPVAIWHSNDGIYSTLPTITAFESGKKYVYSVMLLPERGYDFSREVAATVNGNSVTAVPATDGYLSLPNVKTITPTGPINPTVIDLIEINDVTVSFKDGDKPKFTGSVPDNAGYAFRCEWWSLDSDTGIVSTEPEWGGDIYKNKITAFKAGKTYHYGVYVSAYYNDISLDATLKINGQKVKYMRVNEGGDTQNFWVETELTMTPMVDSHTHSYGANWKSDTNDHWHECACGDKADTAVHTFKWVTDKEATATEKGSKHEECTVCGYKKAAVDIPATGSGDGSADQPNKPGNTSSPQTGDNSSLALWFPIMLISGGAVIGTTVVSKKKRCSVKYQKR